MAPQNKWQDFSQKQKAAVVVLGAVEVALTLTAAIDLIRRPSEQVRGPKLMWAGALVVQPFGPIAYLTLGRHA